MSAVNDPLSLARAGLRCARLAAVTGGGYASLFTDDLLFGMPDGRRDDYVRWWSGGMLRALGVSVTVERDVELPPSPVTGGRLVVSNHRSMVDVLLLLSEFGGHLLSRADLAKWPLIGRMAPTAGTLYVDRSSPSSGAAAVRAITSKLDAGATVGVFAEGTTYPDDAVREFHPGTFLAIARTGGEVVPVGIAYAGTHATYFQEPFGDHAKRLLLAEETRVSMVVGRPMSAAGKRAKALCAETHAAVSDLVKRARARV